MSRAFEQDLYPGKPRILFIGLAESTHTHSWIELLEGSELNVRLFGLPSGIPPKEWGVKTYLTAKPPFDVNPCNRISLYPFGNLQRLAMRGISHFILENDMEFEERWLARVIRRWRPDVIHTLGLDPAGEFYYRVRTRFKLAGMGYWVIQLRGGSDLTLKRLNPSEAEKIAQILNEGDQLISDNEQNFLYARQLGVREERFSTLGTVPGTGGVDVEALSSSWDGPPSSRRVILWPKAYESPWSKALPVFEAIKLCWEKIQPCEVYLFAMTPEVLMWFRTLPENIRKHCHVEPRIPRDFILDLVKRARVMLIPSLIDGTPNSLFEAMAAGAFPILSPLESHLLLRARRMYYLREISTRRK
jgi:glycosyltransferase involved in cell wall biosynthesis